ncbi:MAG: hypothetical protein GXO42_01345 [bacterium]|nr:hypothetical protein [bacterium]
MRLPLPPSYKYAAAIAASLFLLELAWLAWQQLNSPVVPAPCHEELVSNREQYCFPVAGYLPVTLLEKNGKATRTCIIIYNDTYILLNNCSEKVLRAVIEGKELYYCAGKHAVLAIFK